MFGADLSVIARSVVASRTKLPLATQSASFSASVDPSLRAGEQFEQAQEAMPGMVPCGGCYRRFLMQLHDLSCGTGPE